VIQTKTILLADQCPTGNVGNVGNVEVDDNSPTIRNVLNELGPATPDGKGPVHRLRPERLTPR